MPAPAPETIAVLPLRENRGRTFVSLGAAVLLWAKLPPFIAESAMAVLVREVVVEKGMNDGEVFKRLGCLYVQKRYL